jgi:hypothetical protein
MSHWENAPNVREIMRVMAVMVDLCCASHLMPPDAVALDIDDVVDVLHGHQRLSPFNVHYDERCFLPIHVYRPAGPSPSLAMTSALAWRCRGHMMKRGKRRIRLAG